MAIRGVNETRVYSGEVWTDARGRATVVLPMHVEKLDPNFEYELTPTWPAHGRARIASELRNHSFTIETERPHSKVAWKVTAQSVTEEEKK